MNIEEQDIMKEVVNYLKDNERAQCSDFMKRADVQFQMYLDEDDRRLLKFIAEKSFKAGYMKGVVAVFNTFEAFKAAKESNE